MTQPAAVKPFAAQPLLRSVSYACGALSDGVDLQWQRPDRGDSCGLTLFPAASYNLGFCGCSV